MNNRKYLTLPYTFLLICLIPIQQLSAQDWNYQIGLNSSHFRFQSPLNQTQNTYHPEAGLHLSLHRSERLIDTSKTTSRFLRKLDYQVGLAINQFNSFGEAQNIPFSYTTTYMGLILGLGMKSELGKGWQLSYGSLLQSNKLILGSQKMGNNVYHLPENDQVNRIQFQVGGEVKISKRMNSQTALFTYFSESWQLNTIQPDGSQLAINPTSFGFGIQYSPLK
jgi:hypothetical protein